jgi:hypothetical protein
VGSGDADGRGRSGGGGGRRTSAAFRGARLPRAPLPAGGPTCQCGRSSGLTQPPSRRSAPAAASARASAAALAVPGALLPCRSSVCSSVDACVRKQQQDGVWARLQVSRQAAAAPSRHALHRTAVPLQPPPPPRPLLPPGLVPHPRPRPRPRPRPTSSGGSCCPTTAHACSAFDTSRSKKSAPAAPRSPPPAWSVAARRDAHAPTARRMRAGGNISANGGAK